MQYEDIKYEPNRQRGNLWDPEQEGSTPTKNDIKKAQLINNSFFASVFTWENTDSISILHRDTQVISYHTYILH